MLLELFWGKEKKYTTIKKELFYCSIYIGKFCSYLISSSTIVYYDHVAVRYLMSTQGVKSRLIQ